LPYPKATPSLEAYVHLLHFWRLHISRSEPDQERLRALHQALCLLEMLLHHEELDQCMRNLQERLQQAQQLGMDLPLPSWAAQQSEILKNWALENVNRGERP
jgi:hypothetical protein